MSRLLSLCLAVALVALLAAPAAAQLPVRPWIAVGAGWSNHAMDEVNDLLEQTGQELGMELEKVDSGWCGIASAGVKLPKIGVALHYERLIVGSDTDQMGLSTVVGLDASAFYGTVDLYLTGAPLMRFGVGGGIGGIKTSDDFEPAEGSSAQAASIEGSGGLYQLHVFGELGTGIFLRPVAGYRWAKIDDAEADGEPLGAEIDYSGFFLRLSVGLGF